MDNARKFWAFQHKSITGRRLQSKSQPIRMVDYSFANSPSLPANRFGLREPVLPIMEQDVQRLHLHSNTNYDSRASTSPGSERDQRKPATGDSATLLQHHSAILPVYKTKRANRNSVRPCSEVIPPLHL